jgi:hypothetical protein
MGVRLRAHHPAVAVAKPMHVQLSGALAAQRLDRAVQLRGADLTHPRLRFLRVERWVVDLALLPAGADHQVDPTSLGDRAGDEAAGGEDLVVRVGVDEEQPRGSSVHAFATRCSSHSHSSRSFV